MTLIIVDAVSDVVASVQFTTVPFRPLLTGLIDNVNVSGKTFSAEFLEYKNVESQFFVQIPEDGLDQSVEEHVCTS